MTKRLAFRHKHSGEVHVTTSPSAYGNRKEWQRVPVPKDVAMSAEDKRSAKVRGMTSLERHDALLAEIAELRARLDKAGL